MAVINLLCRPFLEVMELALTNIKTERLTEGPACAASKGNSDRICWMLEFIRKIIRKESLLK